MRELETGAQVFQGCHRRSWDEEKARISPGRNQGERRSWEEAGDPGRNGRNTNAGKNETKIKMRNRKILVLRQKVNRQ